DYYCYSADSSGYIGVF
nr:immunoglobulin light chain junction region [Macaca mulatta]MOW27262.1 immunoglobulin light chain junction region [Macaca mulatta]MOW27294.1 immunoglobulin light chain junction region [Macaca mulatta]MOW27411.1 immunoglobulin light chain junction region [Macaca mulatta]MOW27582.1 immunoglobulin light chain junction region [Macaca mulatta]